MAQQRQMHPPQDPHGSRPEIARSLVHAAPAAIAGQANGSATRQNAATRLCPSDRAVSMRCND